MCWPVANSQLVSPLKFKCGIARSAQTQFTVVLFHVADYYLFIGVDARPEESGQYRCEVLTKDSQSSQLTYNLIVTGM